MIRLIVFVFCYFLMSMHSLSGQIVVDSIKNNLSLVNNKDVRATFTEIGFPFEKIANQKKWQAFDSTLRSLPNKTLWLHFEIENKSADSISIYLYSTDDLNTIYLRENQKIRTLKNGSHIALSQRSNQEDYFFTRLSFLPFEKSEVYVELNSRISRSRINIPTIYSANDYQNLIKSKINDQEKFISFIYFYIISIVTIFIFTLVVWLHLLNRLYLYYLGYLFFLIVYGFLVLRYTSAPVLNFFLHFPEFAFGIFEPTQFLFIGFYILFVIQLLNVKHYDRRLAKSLYFLAVFCFIYALMAFIIAYFTTQPQLERVLQFFIRLTVLPINFILFIWIIYKVKHRLLSYFIMGQSVFFVSALLSSYVGFSDINTMPQYLVILKNNANVIFQLGLLAEVYCFSLALGKNIFVLQKEKDFSKLKLIEQLQENQRLQESMNRELDVNVRKKTDELITLYSEMEREREQKITDDFHKKIRETEMMALRAQMNPHFIFNSMNAIKSLIMSFRTADAITYLDDFSSLLRSILQNSSCEKITVEEELEILELYLSLEKSRLGDNFKYQIEVNSREALSQYEIPPLLLQPIVENAIWHGLHPSLKAEKMLSIVFDTTENLQIIIRDNGVGRKESAKNKKLHQSMGTSIVQERLTLFNYLNEQNILLKISDLEDELQILGTQITITYQL